MRQLRVLFLLALARWVGAVHGQITEEPTTVAPGRFLVELDVLSLTSDRSGGDRYTAWGAASTFISTGLAANWDVQLGVDLYRSQAYASGGFTERHSGFGDVYVRTKWRFYENKITGNAFALLPYVKIPTNSGSVGNRSLEGGLIVPWSTKLPGDLSLAAMAELDFLRNGVDDGYESGWYATLVMSRPVTNTVGLYGEFAAAKSPPGAPWESTMGVGMTISVTDKFWWDVAVYRGLTRGAADWNPIVRLNWEF